MRYQQLIDGMKKYKSNERDICVHCLGVEPDVIRRNVVIAPWWEPKYLALLGEAEYLSESQFSAIKVWNIKNKDQEITFIKTGIGAPVFMDALLALGLTKCRNVIFVGSVGSLDTSIGIGDIVIPQYSICGDGASRYIASESLVDNDVFGSKVTPNKTMFDTVCRITEEVCKQDNVRFHIGKAFSIDSVFAQYAHIDQILNMGCNVIEMETASAFRAAEVAGLSIAAIFSVSDNTVTNKSLISGRTESDMNYRRFVRNKLFPKIILKVFENMTAG
jgi:purine-nucleoside phosphorylase